MNVKTKIEFRNPSDAAKEFGIGLNVTFSIINTDSDETFIKLYDGVIRWTDKQNGRWFFSPPSRKGTDKEGKTSYFNSFAFYPDNRESNDKFLKKLLELAKKQGFELPERGPKKVVKTNAKKASTPEEAWDADLS